MPKKIDYPSRFEFLREAAFALVRDRGVRALGRQQIADELGTSVSTVRRILDPEASLVGLAASAVARRRQKIWCTERSWTSPQTALSVASALLPREAGASAALVWMRLLLEAGPQTVDPDSDPEADLPLHELFRMAEGGHPHEERPAVAAAREADAVLGQHIPEREDEFAWRLDRVLTLLDVPDEEREKESVLLRALIDGLTMGICLRGLSTQTALKTLAAHLEHLDRRPQAVSRVG